MEPTIRVGVVLPADGMHTIYLRIPTQGYLISTDNGQGEVFRSIPAKLSVEGRQVVFLSESGVVGPAEVITLSPEEEGPLEQGAGIRLRGVITGRGFHWQKRMHPTMCGTLECRLCQGRLLVVNELPLEDYLPGVIAGEMSGDCPLEFLKSQCLVARSWVLAHTENKHPDLPIDRCNDDCCQRYHGTTDLTATALEAVRATCGQVLVDDHLRIIDANYSKTCGGIIESPQHVWSVCKSGQRAAVDAPPHSQAHRFFPLTSKNLDEYLTGSWLAETDVFCSPNVIPEKDLPRYLSKVDEGGGHFRWRICYNREDLETVLREKFFARQDPSRVASLGTLTDLRVAHRGESGRATDLEIEYLDPMGTAHRVNIKSEYAIRDSLHEKFLYSSALRITIERDDSDLPVRITFIGAGWGHGAGLCQIGALGMALKGYDDESIVKHYFEGTEIHTCYQ